MFNKLKKMLGLSLAISGDERIDIQVGVFQGKLHIKLSKKVDVVTFDKTQLTQLLAAIAGQAVNVK